MNVVCRRLMLTLLLLAAASDLAMGQYVSRGYLPTAAARRLGLKSVWNKQIGSTRTPGTVSDVFQFVSADSNYGIHEIEFEGRKIIVSERDLDRNGGLLGKERAARLARQSVIALKEARRDPQHTTRQVPEVTLYLTSSDGLVHAIDAETGRKLWSTRVGKPGYPTLRPAANELTLAVISGSTLHLLRRDSGRIFWKERLSGVPAAGPAISNQMVFTIASDGLVEAFQLKALEKAPWGFQSMGRGAARPLVSASTVSWTTDRGHLYVGDAEKGGVKYRLEAAGSIRSAPAFVGSTGLVAVTSEGLVYGLNRLSGDIQWRTATGYDSRVAPVAIGQRIYVQGDPSGLSRLHARTGKAQWRVGGITKFVAASEERIYCLDDRQRFVTLDMKTGATLSAASAHGIELAMTNSQTDRILLGTKKGRIQYFREQSLDVPLVHVKLYSTEDLKGKHTKPAGGEREAPSDRRDDESDTPGTDESDTDDKDVDDSPFEFDDEGDSEDPFGTGDDSSAEDEDDPFGS